ncbi:MAG: TonB-dependent receptor, partial [Candidatus Rokuibacteriota bacterium]
MRLHKLHTPSELLIPAVAVCLLGIAIGPVAAAQDQAAEQAVEPDQEGDQAGEAQEAEEAEEPESVFDTIVVTATKREEDIFKVPLAISAFEPEALEKQHITDLTDVGKFVPNLNVTGFSAGHTASANPFIRGIGLQDHLIATDPGVGVYVDGVYLGRQVGQNWSLANIERIEVLRGPQGTLYGRNSIGGAINIITRKPGAEDGGRVALQVGTRGRLNGEFYTNNALSDSVALSVTGAFQRRDGLGEFRLLENPRKEVGELQDISGRIQLLWEPSERFSLLLAADGNEGDNGLRPYRTLIDEVPNGALANAGFSNADTAADPYDNNTGQAEQVAVTNQAHGVALTATYAVSDNLTAKLIASDRHSEYSAGLDDDSFFENFLTFPEDGFADQTAVEVQFNGVYGDLDFVSGLYYYTEDGENAQIPFVFLGGPGTYVIAQEVDSRAAYGNVGYRVNDRTRLAAGVRYTEDDKNAFVNISDFLETPGNRDWSELSWDLSGSFEFNQNLLGYAAIQNGYQSGQFPARAFCLFGNIDPTQPGNVSPNNCFVANDNITALNYEAGIKGQPLSNLQMSLAVFYTDYTDLPYQVSTTTGAGFDTRNIIVDQTSTGVEWESSWVVGGGFRLYTTAGYIDVDVDDPVAVAPLTPEWTASVSPELNLPAANGGSYSLRADWSFRDDMFGEPTPDPGRFTRIESRELINADVTYYAPNGKWSLSAYGTNITDERYDNARLNTGDYILVMLS